MNPFYVNICRNGDFILYRGVNSQGQKVKRREKFQPTLFVPTQNTKSKYHTIHGENVEAIQPGSMRECQNFVKEYDHIPGVEIYGNTNYTFQYINEEHPKEVDWDIKNIRVMMIDIETQCENRFPYPESASEQVNVITLRFLNGGDDNQHTFTVGTWEQNQSSGNNHIFKDEISMLAKFLEVWEQNMPDIVTGWNSNFFDIPYLIRRITKILGEKNAQRLSPWKKLYERTKKHRGQEVMCYDILGVSQLDYLELYRTFTYTNQESYKLDHIAWIELKERKLDYSEYGSIKDFYKQDFTKFVEYNIHDVLLIEKLEKKMKLIELALALAYDAKVNYEDVFSQIRTWDTIIYHYLMGKKIVIPQRKHTDKDHQYTGAYVKEPQVGSHDWVVSYDLASLYPNIIIGTNISPDTILDIECPFYNTLPIDITIEELLDKKIDTTQLPDQEVSLAANGVLFDNEHQGFLGELLEKMYAERKMYKGKMIEAQKQKEALGENISKQEREDSDFKIAKFNNFQMVRKIQLNSCYGALGSPWFRFFDLRMAEAITKNGQLTIRWLENSVNKHLNKLLDTDDVKYILASDTDSIYVTMGPLVEKLMPQETDKNKIVDFLDKTSEKVIVPFIQKQCAALTKYINSFKPTLVMEREVIANRGIWTAKKRYALNVYDSEGVRYKEPKLKIMGIETTRSSTPQVCRDDLKKAIKLILTTDEDTVIEHIEGFEKKFMKMTPEEIAFPRGVNNMEKWYSGTSIYTKGTPVAVKGSLLYNHKVKDDGLLQKYPTIKSGEKIKFVYLKVPNTLRDKVISFPGKLPPEFMLHTYVDYNLMFEKAFLEPLKKILEKIGWHTEKKQDLESLFV